MLGTWKNITYPFYSPFFLYTALKILAIATAMSAFFALSKEKMTSQNLGTLFISNSLIYQKRFFFWKIGRIKMRTLYYYKANPTPFFNTQWIEQLFYPFFYKKRSKNYKVAQDKNSKGDLSL